MPATINRTLAVSIPLLLVLAGPASGLDIVPTFVDSVHGSWDATRRGVVNHAISDWELAIADAQMIAMDFTFTDVGTGGYLGQWNGSFSGIPVGTDVYAWTPGVSHTINFNAALFSTGLPNYTWWDPTPVSHGDQPFSSWDALSVSLHELGHALGFTDGFYVDDLSLPGEFDKWDAVIVGDTFDPSGLNVALAPGDLAHTAFSAAPATDGLMVQALTNSFRRDISATDLAMLELAYGYTIGAAVAPEPGSGLLLMGGMVGLAWWRRREIAGA